MHVCLPDTHTGTPAVSGAAAALHGRCSRSRGVRGRYVAAGAGCLRLALRDEISLACEDPGLRVERVLDTDRGGDDDDSIASDLGLPAPAGRVLKVPVYQDACAREPLLTQRPPGGEFARPRRLRLSTPAPLAVSWDQHVPGAMVRWRVREDGTVVALCICSCCCLRSSAQRNSLFPGVLRFLYLAV
jgi:hypothetical protein